MTDTAAQDSIRIATQFADMYRAGAHGAEMDFEAAQKLALSIDDILAALRASPAPDRVSDERLEQIAADRADWLVDAVATSTQNRAFLRGEPEEDEVATESIYLNGKKAILVALSKASK